ncbi:MAG: crossover junction endodeoxyribonuclease RuvC [Deltaproteobacteria bacterium]|nr:MAG: crossover junction endodeoxyribonuclease RuvC [Deltaproteobacteria bacterium]
MNSNTPLLILGIDPGSNITGYGLVKKQGSQLIHIDNGCLTTKRSQELPQRLHSIHASLREIIQKYKPDCMAIEEVFFAKNVSSSLRLGEARGVALLAAAQEGVEIFEYSTRVVKQALTGFGQAQKEQVQKMVQKLLKLPEVAQIDASDALALAICHANTYKMRSL